jgi:hypothetical protein
MLLWTVVDLSVGWSDATAMSAIQVLYGFRCQVSGVSKKTNPESGSLIGLKQKFVSGENNQSMGDFHPAGLHQLLTPDTRHLITAGKS